MILNLRKTSSESQLLADWWYGPQIGRDASGNANNVTLTNNTGNMREGGAGGWSNKFANSEYGQVLLPSATMKSQQLPLTYVWWSKFDTGASEASGAVLARYSSTTTHRLLTILNHISTFAYYYSTAAGGFQSHTNSVNPTKDVWHRFAVTVNGTLAAPTVSLYMDGKVEVFSGAAMSTTPDLTVPWTIGCTSSSGVGSEKWTGHLGPMRVYGRALAKIEIDNLFARGNPTFMPRTQIRFYTGYYGTISGRTYSAGAPVARRVVLMTEPPNSRVIAEFTTSASDGLFSFTQLPAGNYLVLDCMTDNTKQAIAYDWVVVS